MLWEVKDVFSNLDLTGAGSDPVQPLLPSHRGHPCSSPSALTLPPTPHTLLHFGFVKQQNLSKKTEDILSSGITVLCDQAMQIAERLKDSGKLTISKAIMSFHLFLCLYCCGVFSFGFLSLNLSYKKLNV